jgi:hypothetical protein
LGHHLILVPRWLDAPDRTCRWEVRPPSITLNRRRRSGLVPS